MKSKWIYGTIVGMAAVGVLAVAPMAVNAQSNQSQNRRVGQSGMHEGAGAGKQGSGQQVALETRAKALGMTTEELGAALQTRTMLQIAAEKGFSEEQFHAKMQETSRARWEARGLTAEQVQIRETQQEQRQADCDGTGSGKQRGQSS